MSDALLRRAEVRPRRLVVVTNREPFHIIDREGESRIERTAGGLISALEPAMQSMDGLWVSGCNERSVQDPRLAASFAELPYEWQPVEIPEELREPFYLGFSNGALWPLFHGMLGLTAYHRRHWGAYRLVNERFADAVRARLRPGDFVWVHDYQLALLPDLLRAGGLPDDVRIGFFLHIPFPDHSAFRTLPWAKEILRGILGANLIGFHVPEYVKNFFDSVEEELNLRCDRIRNRAFVDGHFRSVRAIPIGIDTARVVEATRAPATEERVRKLREDIGTRFVVLGVDRLDYTKGIPERLKAMATFFERYPERRGEVTLLQLAVPSRGELDTYQQLREELEREVGHINGLFGRPGWTPINYLCRSMPFEELVALYRAADVALVTPLRDGMNLVAKEYVAAQHEQGGVLVLSELAGAASELTEATLVNPYHVDGIAAALEQALREPLESRARRMATMFDKVARFDVAHWVEAFLREGLYAEPG